jgi:allophanate hydrolase subunit 1
VSRGGAAPQAFIGFAAALLLGLSTSHSQAAPAQVDTIREIVEKLRSCWKPPPASRAHPGIDITVIVSFNRSGEILGHPRITYESEQATDNDRLAYRIAVMETLQRCTPMPFTEGMAGAVAGRPFAVQFHNRKIPPQPTEKRAWLTPKIP